MATITDTDKLFSAWRDDLARAGKLIAYATPEYRLAAMGKIVSGMAAGGMRLEDILGLLACTMDVAELGDAPHGGRGERMNQYDEYWERQPVDVNLLLDLGFETGTGFDKLTYVWDGAIWVECDGNTPACWYTYIGDERGEPHPVPNRRTFLRTFLDLLVENEHERTRL